MATKLPAANVADLTVAGGRKIGKVVVIFGIGGGGGEQMETATRRWIPLLLELHVT
jgi:hypothetical protein